MFEAGMLLPLWLKKYMASNDLTIIPNKGINADYKNKSFNMQDMLLHRTPKYKKKYVICIFKTVSIVPFLVHRMQFVFNLL